MPDFAGTDKLEQGSTGQPAQPIGYSNLHWLCLVGYGSSRLVTIALERALQSSLLLLRMLACMF